MKQANRSSLERAIGIIEGVAMLSSEKTKHALFTATNLVDEFLAVAQKRLWR